MSTADGFEHALADLLLDRVDDRRRVLACELLAFMASTAVHWAVRLREEDGVLSALVQHAVASGSSVQVPALVLLKHCALFDRTRACACRRSRR